MTEKADKPDKRYRGRFAPSPTGRLHFGSLVTAVGSYLDARHHQGEWLVRIEDIDPPREVPGASDDILRTLELFGMEWDGPVIYQSEGAARYESALVQLEANGHLYGCACTRRDIADSTLNGKTHAVYPGTCRNGIPSGRKARSLRLRLDGGTVTLNDRLQGITRQSLHQEVGDFIVRRADQRVAYQLAVVVDDAHQEMTHIVRGVDLLDSTPRQICLQQLLQLPTPEYLHLPLATNTGGDKLSKQTQAHSIDPDNPVAGLRDALLFLQQELPDSPDDARLEELWQWAIDHWDVTAIPACRTIVAPGRYYW